MSYVRGQVLTAGGRLMASVTQDAMIGGRDDNGAVVPGKGGQPPVATDRSAGFFSLFL
jgi:hypothetical protein